MNLGARLGGWQQRSCAVHGKNNKCKPHQISHVTCSCCITAEYAGLLLPGLLHRR